MAGLAVLTLTLNALGYLRILECARAYSRDGITLHQARQQVASRIQVENPSAEATIGYPPYSNPSFVAFAQPGLLRLIGTTGPALKPTGEEHPTETSPKNKRVEIDYYLHPQPSGEPGSTPPVTIFFGQQAYRLIDSQQLYELQNIASRLITRIIWPFLQGYHYALYKRS